jgi:hypothetical protein
MNTESTGSINKQASPAALQLPIFFVQLGTHVNLFFDQVLQQAQLSNGKENVYVLTDSNAHLYSAYNCIDVSKYMQGREFDRLYQHHSTNKYFFEKACFDRWFIINDLVKELNIPYFFHADCDVLVLEDLKPFYTEQLQGRYDGSAMYFEDGARSITSGHSSFWSSALLNQFCNFVCEKYANEQAFNKIWSDARAGVFYDNTNVSDMILLDVFRREQQTNTLNLFSTEDEGQCFDFNINVAYNGRKQSFKMNSRYHIKQIKPRDGSIYGKAEDGQQYLFYTLHFQGYLTKALIPLYITGGNAYQQMRNRLLSARSFTIRKLKLAKNRLKGAVKETLKR